MCWRIRIYPCPSLWSETRPDVNAARTLMLQGSTTNGVRLAPVKNTFTWCVQIVVQPGRDAKGLHCCADQRNAGAWSVGASSSRLGGRSTMQWCKIFQRYGGPVKNGKRVCSIALSNGFKAESPQGLSSERLHAASIPL